MDEHVLMVHCYSIHKLHVLPISLIAAAIVADAYFTTSAALIFHRPFAALALWCRLLTHVMLPIMNIVSGSPHSSMIMQMLQRLQEKERKND